MSVFHLPIDVALACATELIATRAPMLPKPEHDARLLLAHVLGVPVETVERDEAEALEPEQVARYFAAVQRRAEYEPIGYIRGYRYFCGRRFVVNRHVMIPRPITEQIVTAALQAARAAEGPVVIVDVGTGCGAIAVSIALECEHPVAAVDISADAITVARENARALGAEHRIAFFQGDLITPIVDALRLVAPKPAHLILAANLPYLPRSEWGRGDKEAHGFEPRVAFDGGDAGLSLYERLFQQIDAHRDALPPRVDVVQELEAEQRRPMWAAIRDAIPDARVVGAHAITGDVEIVVTRCERPSPPAEA